MAILRHPTHRYSSQPAEDVDYSLLPDYNREFITERDLNSFALALGASEVSIPSNERGNIESERDRADVKSLEDGNKSIDGLCPEKKTKEPSKSRETLFITAQNDWAPVYPTPKSGGTRGKRKGSGKFRPSQRTSDETREGYVYMLLKWPLLGMVSILMLGLAICYLLTRLYVWLYEYYIVWRGHREDLRKKLQTTTNYVDWIEAAEKLDKFLGNDQWKRKDKYAYYDHKTVRKVQEQMRRCRQKIDGMSQNYTDNCNKESAVEELQAILSACVKNNFVGVENPRLYSETYYGTKNIVQDFIDEVERGISILANTCQLNAQEKRILFKRMQTNYGRTALCLSGGASFAYYHFGVVKALLDADLLPSVITGTSGGSLIAALVATRTNDELQKLIVPALAGKINGCSEPMYVWFPRWWKTGARFDSLVWARKCSWFTRGSMTFREAYERTGRILNVTCIPADPHSPSPDCVIWSAVLASAAVPGILNPVVLMMKNKSGYLVPYSFGHKWKDGSLRTDIPLKSLNLHFNVNFSIVSQVNPHINLFFFSSRGTVGQPVTHRKGRGWRGGFLGSATEQYIKLELNKWLKVIRSLELLPRPLGQDWSEVWLQKFSGNITIWPRSTFTDLWRILSDPDPNQLARMIHVGQQSTFPKLKFISNRLKVERMIARGRQATRVIFSRGSIESIISKEDMRNILRLHESPATEDEETEEGSHTTTWDQEEDDDDESGYDEELKEEIQKEKGVSILDEIENWLQNKKVTRNSS